MRARSEGQVARHAIERRVLEVTLGVERPVGPAALDLRGQQVLGRAPGAIAGLPETEKVEVVFVGGGIQRRQLDELLAAREARDHELLVRHGPALVTDVLVDEDAGIEPGRDSRRQPERMYRRRGEALDRVVEPQDAIEIVEAVDRRRRLRAQRGRDPIARAAAADPCGLRGPGSDARQPDVFGRLPAGLLVALAVRGSAAAPTHTTKPRRARQPVIRAAAYRKPRARRPARARLGARSSSSVSSASRSARAPGAEFRSQPR